jgi:serine protease AprX
LNKYFKPFLLTVFVLSLVYSTIVTSNASETDQEMIANYLNNKDIKTELSYEFEDYKVYKVESGNELLEISINNNSGEVQHYDPSTHQNTNTDKLSQTLKEELNKIGDQDNITVQIWTKGINQEVIMKAVKEKIPNLVDSNGKFIGKTMDEVNKFTEITRAITRNKYTKHHTLLKETLPSNAKVLFSSKYAPFLIIEVNKNDIESLRQNNDVLSIDFFKDRVGHESTSNSIPNIRADKTKSSGLNGSGVKIGIVEYGYDPDHEDPELNHLNIQRDPNKYYFAGEHATQVTSIIAGETKGIVPNASIYTSWFEKESEFYKSIEWLLDQGVQVINISAGFAYTDTCGVYSNIDQWVDHIAMQPSVHVVVATGNDECITEAGLDKLYVNSPAMAYNAISVGAININGDADWSNDEWGTKTNGEVYSAYVRKSGTAYKPNLTAPGTAINSGTYTGTGTSLSAPHVTAVIAQMIELEPSLATKQSAMNAILPAGTGRHKTADDYGIYSLSTAISNKEGAGVVDAWSTNYVVGNGRYKSIKLHKSEFPYETTFYVGTDTLNRVALSWLKRNTMDSNGNVSNPTLSDLDLYVYDPDGNEVGRSRSGPSNFELVEFVPQKSGYYTIKVDPYRLDNEYETIGIAWW